MTSPPPTAPPGPRGYPLLGVFPRARRDPLAFFLDTAHRYGDIVSMRFGTRRVYLLSHPDDVRHVLQDHAHAYGKSAPAARVRSLFGDSLTTVDGDRWQRQRRLMRPVFQPKRIGFLIPVITDTTATMLERWQGLAARGEAVDVFDEMRTLTRAVMLRVLFGDVAAADARRVGEALDLALEHADRRLWSSLGWLDVPTPAARRFRQALRVIDGFVSTMSDGGGRESTSAETLLSIVGEARDAATGARMSDAELRDEVKALLVAGHTTTTSALASVWHMLAEHPEVRETVQREVSGRLAGRRPEADDVPALAYTRMVIDEVLRLYPPTWLTARTPLEEDDIRGHRLPVGSIVLLSPFVTHRHPAFWDEPHWFDPERFTPGRCEGRPRFAYFPFGGGPRSCIGAWLASTTIQLVTAMVAQELTLLLVPGYRVASQPGLTLRPGPRLVMRLERPASWSKLLL
jgi:cytochrome P450